VTANRAARGLSTALIVAGALVLTDVGITLVWQEPVTALITLRHQHALSGQLDTLEAQGPTAFELAQMRGLPTLHRRRRAAGTHATPTPWAGRRRGTPGDPRLHQSVVIVNGSDAGSLREGPGSMTRRRSRARPARPRSPVTAPRTWRRSATSTG
jgi:sortase A